MHKMEKTLHVELKENRYPIIVGAGNVTRIGEYIRSLCKSTKVLIVTDTSVKHHYSSTVMPSLDNHGFDVNLMEVPVGESSKSLEQFALVQDRLIEHQLDRSSMVIALGGGVVGDLAGFAASVYMRGIDYIQIPTTLQAQVDASVGGKTAINHVKGKNLIGTFHQPKLVLIDVDTLKTLPERDLRAGLIEVIKMGVIRDEYLFELVEKNLDVIIDLDAETVVDMIARACANKADIVAKDEKESRLRMVLNYGHTFGHALEALSSYDGLRHGEAVSIGMNCAAQLAVNLGILSETDFERQRNLIIQAELPHVFPADLPPKAICDAMYYDKKALDGNLRLILPTRIGEVVIRDDVTDSQIIEAISQCY